MKFTMKILVSLAMLGFAIACNGFVASPKLRRGGMMLIPFPRVGRASGKTWQLPVSNMYLENERRMLAYPRIGRSVPEVHDDSQDVQPISQDLQPMPLRRTEGPGMWFGPRLGRGFKIIDENHHMVPYPRIGRSMPMVHTDSQKYRRTDSPGMWFGPRLGRAFKIVYAKDVMAPRPRIGRTMPEVRDDSDDYKPMSHRRTESPGMWFGPRLGRSDENEISNESNDRGEPEQMESIQENRRKRQTLN